MMSEETRTWLRRILGHAVGLTANVLQDEGEDGAASFVEALAPTIVERILEEVVDESVELVVRGTASGLVDFSRSQD